MDSVWQNPIFQKNKNTYGILYEKNENSTQSNNILIFYKKIKKKKSLWKNQNFKIGNYVFFVEKSKIKIYKNKLWDSVWEKQNMKHFKNHFDFCWKSIKFTKKTKHMESRMEMQNFQSEFSRGS